MSGVVACSVTDRGRALARRLPFEHQHGNLVATVAGRWHEVDAFVFVCATGIAVRAIAPHLGGKADDPAVVAVDDGGRYALALAGGHRARVGANALARFVAALLGAEPVVTTASDEAGVAALDSLPGFTPDGDAAGVMRAWLDGAPPSVEVDAPLAAWPIPAGLTRRADDEAVGTGGVLVTDRAVAVRSGTVVLRPRSLVVGVGASTRADRDRLHDLALDALRAAGLHPASVGVVATIDARRDEPAVVEAAARFGVPVRSFPADALATVDVPNASDVVEAAVGTPSVSEAAALLAAGPGGALVVEKRKSVDATVAVARRARPEGHLAVVGLGPGDPAHRTPAAATAVRHADCVVGYEAYVDQVADLLEPRQHILPFPLGEERERCSTALRRAAAGERVALVCSGDPGVYAMASLVHELAPVHGGPPVMVVPGVTAALAAAAVLGAPLGHDHAAVSLSDLLTPWPVIERRLRAVAEADLVVSLYNPRSKRRTTQLEEALSILAAHRPPSTPAAVVTAVGRPGEEVVRTTVAGLDPTSVGMLSLVVVGATTTRWIGDRMVTPRGYAT
jgi:cobalt-precorrin 5A hydrolase/precorrin-3B C17-methyltransferase